MPVLWYYSKQELKRTPSILDGLDPETESRYRRDGARFIHEIGNKLGLQSETKATGIIYFHRFYMHHSFKDFPRYVTACCCLFLAGKVEETPKKCRDIIKNAKAELSDQQFAQFGEHPREEIMTLERILLQTVRFDLQVDNPYRHVVKYAANLRGNREKLHLVVQSAWTLVNDSLCTTLCLQWEPEIIAIALMYLACKFSKFEVVDWAGRTPKQNKWWDAYVDGMSVELLEDVCHQVLDLYSTPSNQASPPSTTQSSRPVPTKGSAFSTPKATKNDSPNSSRTPPITTKSTEVSPAPVIQAIPTVLATPSPALVQPVSKQMVPQVAAPVILQPIQVVSSIPCSVSSPTVVALQPAVATIQAATISTFQPASVSTLQPAPIPTLQPAPIPILQPAPIPTLQSVPGTSMQPAAGSTLQPVTHATPSVNHLAKTSQLQPVPHSQHAVLPAAPPPPPISHLPPPINTPQAIQSQGIHSTQSGQPSHASTGYPSALASQGQAGPPQPSGPPQGGVPPSPAGPHSGGPLSATNLYSYQYPPSSNAEPSSMHTGFQQSNFSEEEPNLSMDIGGHEPIYPPQRPPVGSCMMHPQYENHSYQSQSYYQPRQPIPNQSYQQQQPHQPYQYSSNPSGSPARPNIFHQQYNGPAYNAPSYRGNPQQGMRPPPRNY